jgi:hypothetical protein
LFFFVFVLFVRYMFAVAGRGAGRRNAQHNPSSTHTKVSPHKKCE